MDKASAHRLVEMLGRNLTKTQNGYRDATALITFLSYEAGWPAAAALADAFDIDEARQEQIYKRTQEQR